MTIAKRLTEMCGGDGQKWVAPDGRAVEEIWRPNSARIEEDRRRGTMRYAFGDGSCIVATEDGWDIGYEERALSGEVCHCWPAAGHHRTCWYSDEEVAEREAEAQRCREYEAAMNDD